MRRISICTYIILSVGLSFLIIQTALPYYCLETLILPGWNIYWSYAEVQRKMMVLFPVMSALGAITTIKKRKTYEDVFLNLAAPMIVLMWLKIAQFYGWIVFICASITLVIVYVRVQCYFAIRDGRISWQKKWKITYYISRKWASYFLLLMFTPLVVWLNVKNYDKELEIFYKVFMPQEQTEGMEEVTDSLSLQLVTEDEWTTLSAEERFDEISKVIIYENQKMNMEGVEIKAVKEIADASRAYFSSEDKESISINITFLVDATLREAMETVIHECYHHQQFKTLECLESMETAGIEYTDLDYFQEIIELREAASSYVWDQASSYDDYRENRLEVDARAYAEQEMRELGQLLGWEGVEK